MSYRVLSAASVEHEVRDFIASWRAADLADRFGHAGKSAGDWLIQALAEGRNRGVVAVDARGILGLLDFTADGERTEFGVFVAETARRQGIARELFRALLRHSPSSALVAQCRADNLAAVACLRALRFSAVARYGVELR